MSGSPFSSAASGGGHVSSATGRPAGWIADAERLGLRWCTPPLGVAPGTVAVTGVFDLLHVGHLRFLQAARAAGERLAVGVEDDARTLARKGVGRPVVCADERCELLAALEPVDGVFVISGPADLPPAPAYRELLRALRPTWLAYTAGDPAAPGRRAVAVALGAEVVEVAPVPGRSTTVIVESFSLRR